MTAKGQITKAVKSLDKAVQGFVEVGDATLHSKQRKARTVMECVEKLEERNTDLDEKYDDLRSICSS